MKTALENYGVQRDKYGYAYFYQKEDALNYIKRFVADCIEPILKKESKGYYIKYFDNGYLKTMKLQKVKTWKTKDVIYAS